MITPLAIGQLLLCPVHRFLQLQNANRLKQIIYSGYPERVKRIIVICANENNLEAALAELGEDVKAGAICYANIEEYQVGFDRLYQLDCFIDISGGATNINLRRIIADEVFQRRQ